MGFENLRFCKEEMESCVKTKTESLMEKEKHKREVLDLKNIIETLTKDLNIKTERERQLALRLEELRLVTLNQHCPSFLVQKVLVHSTNLKSVRMRLIVCISGY